MEWDGLSILQSGNKTMAWLGAVALAAGGTAIVVAAYIQVQRLRRMWRERPAARRTVKPAYATAVKSPVPPVVDAPIPAKPASTPPAQVAAAYRAEQARADGPQAPDHLESPGLEVLDGLLKRLQTAAESLEEVAMKSGRAAGNSEAYQAFLTGLDVEYLHRQN